MSQENTPQGPKNSLTPKQLHFVEEYLANGHNASDAYRAAYTCDTWSDKAIGVEAHRTLHNPKVSLVIAEAKEDMARRMRQKYNVDADRAMRQLVRIGWADIADLYDEHGDLIAPKELDRDVRLAVKGVVYTKREITKPDGTEVIETTGKVEFKDGLGAVKEVVKILGMYEEDNAQRRGDVAEQGQGSKDFDLAEHLGRLYPDPEDLRRAKQGAYKDDKGTIQ